MPLVTASISSSGIASSVPTLSASSLTSEAKRSSHVNHVPRRTTATTYFHVMKHGVAVASFIGVVRAFADLANEDVRGPPLGMQRRFAT